jgi:hypothetical protein
MHENTFIDAKYAGLHLGWYTSMKMHSLIPSTLDCNWDGTHTEVVMGGELGPH